MIGGPRNLMDVISFEGFDYDNYRAEEKTKLNPQIEALGYTNLEWFNEIVKLDENITYERRGLRALGGKAHSLIAGEGKAFYFYYG